MKTLKSIYDKYKHGIPLLIYFAIYMPWFAHLEDTVTKHYQIIHMPIDDYIPFCEIFVVPYFLWFAYVAVAVLLLFFTDKNDFYRSTVFLCVGMTTFLIISTLWPNGHQLRPLEMPRDNIFTQWISILYQTDTSTNIWPSIHVYNSLGAHLALSRSKVLANKRGLRIASLVLAISIILSTVLIKQHSLFDVLTALLLGLITYLVVYRFDCVIALRESFHKKKTKPLAG